MMFLAPIPEPEEEDCPEGIQPEGEQDECCEQEECHGLRMSVAFCSGSAGDSSTNAQDRRACRKRILEGKPQAKIRRALHLKVAKHCARSTDKLALEPIEAPVGMN